MDFWKTMGVLLRRWYVSVPILVVSLGLGGAVFLSVPTQYESTGTLVLTAPPSGGVTQVNPKDATGPGNPLLDFEGSLTITTQLLIQSLSSPTVQQQIGQQGGVDTFQAGDGETGGPFVVIIADAPSKAQAQKTVSLALNFAKNELNQRQKDLDAPASTYIVTQVVVAPTPATTKIGGKVKAGGVALALGLVVSIAAAFAVDSVMTSRRRRRTEQARVTDLDDDRYDDLDDDDDDHAEVTHKMRPAPPPRQLPQPVRATGPRPAPHPQVSSAGRREPYGPGPMPMPVHKPHPGKPRVHPAPVPGTNNGTNNGNGNNGTKGSTNNNHDWPRAEYRSPDKSTG
jgi:hypothetical protein